ncbi:EamA family transporter [Trebonia sp.]|uniref:EamA family transporter n=1 Tax=Trebonia sp. TaxID=2767075 RepID=UPI003BAF5741
MNRRDTLLAVLVASLWGFNFVVIDWGMGSVPPLLFAAIRFTVVAVPACFFVRRPPVPFRTVATVGAFMSLGQFGLLYLSMHLGMPPGLAALVLCVAAGLSWGIGNVVSRASRAPGGLALTVWSATIVPVPLLALSLLVDGPAAVGHGLTHLGWDGAASTVYTAGLCSLVGYAIFNRLLSKYPSGNVVPWVLLAPVVAMAASWALLGEVPGTAEIAGAILLVIGVLIAQRPARSPRVAALDPQIAPSRTLKGVPARP